MYTFCNQIAGSTPRSCAIKNTSDHDHITPISWPLYKLGHTTDVWWEAVEWVHRALTSDGGQSLMTVSHYTEMTRTQCVCVW